MKRLTIALSVAALALPLLAQTEDSPLVRAAKASGRLNKKPGVVITNDTLVLTGGHLATTDVTTPYKKPGQTYSSPPANDWATRPASATPAVQPATPAATVQPTTAVTYQPPAAQSRQVGMVSTTPVSYTTATQPTVATVTPPQP